MSRVERERISCPECGQTSDFEIWSSLNVTLDPDRKLMLLSGELTRFTCPGCGHAADVAYTLLYHDMQAGMMIWLLPAPPGEPPSAPPPGSLPAGMRASMSGYRFRAVRDLNQLREKVYVFENGLDDRVIELVKQVLADRLPPDLKGAGAGLWFAGLGSSAEGDGTPTNGGSGPGDGSGGDVMRFAVLTRDGTRAMEVPKEPVYGETERFVQGRGSVAELTGDWPVVDGLFAKRVLELAPPEPTTLSPAPPAQRPTKPWWKVW